ncbi:HIT-like domain-containing protein [Lipomyces oligophaga]|uniref:HIT-like domain-containing protein n=1 Tax=Lipomyces oligophaga TaxID=45792 RepID=UPI0034CFA9A3
MALNASCLFCKIIKGEIPSYKVYETAKVYAFLDINPLAEGHTLIIPKYHGERTHDIPDEYLADVAPVAKKIALAFGAGSDDVEYNILQNNGTLAHQVVMHVHYHVIPKPTAESGLVIGWPQTAPSQDDLKAVHAKLIKNLEGSE